MMDMRAPAEFLQGAFPSARSLPLMTDDERAQVGICYKQRGQQAAIELGHQLVSGATQAAAPGAVERVCPVASPGLPVLFSRRIAFPDRAAVAAGEGIDYPLVRAVTRPCAASCWRSWSALWRSAEFVLISGKTGTGKTRVINQLSRSVDLEGLANHRGSTFGQLPEPQPRQIDFENTLSIALMKLLAQGERRIYLEDEGRLIGRLYLPEVLREKMGHAPMLVVEQTLEQRVDVVVEDYVLDLGRRYAALHGEDGAQQHSEKLQQDLTRIRKRLGGERHQAGERIDGRGLPAAVAEGTWPAPAVGGFSAGKLLRPHVRLPVVPARGPATVSR